MTAAWGLLACAFLIAFALFEAFAIATGRPTLSRTVWRAEARWPLFSFLVGGMIGGLAVHFFGFNPACNP